jgi:hypothetical protein
MLWGITVSGHAPNESRGHGFIGGERPAVERKSARKNRGLIGISRNVLGASIFGCAPRAHDLASCTCGRNTHHGVVAGAKRVITPATLLGLVQQDRLPT